MIRQPSIIAAIALIAWVPMCVSARQTSSETFERAKMLAEGNQNLSEAIKLYGQVVAQAKNQPKLAAAAQYQIGILYERLGRKADAQRAFKTVANRYADQTSIAARARERITANAKERPPIEIRRKGRSPDGRTLATFTFPKGWSISQPAFDPLRRRAYVVVYRTTDLSPDEKHPRGAKRNLRYLYWPSSTLAVIDTKTNTILKIISFPVFLGWVVYNPANDKLYAAAPVDGHVRVIDPNTCATITKSLVPGFPNWIAVNPLTNKVYLSSQGFAGNDKLFVIDGVTNILQGPFDLKGIAGRVVVNTATNRIYAWGHEKTRVFDGRDNSVLADLPGIEIIAADLAQNRLYGRTSIMRRTGVLKLLDGITHTVIGPVGYHGVQEGDLNSETGRFYFSIADRNQIVAIDTSMNSEVGRLYGGYPHYVSSDPATGNLYICHQGPVYWTISMVERVSLEQGQIPDEFLDSFDAGKLDTLWEVIKRSGSYSLTENPGHLRIRTSIPTGPAPNLTLMRKFRGDHWVFETKVSYFTGSGGGVRQLRLAIAFGAPELQNEPGPDSCISIGRHRGSWDDCCPGWIAIEIKDNKADVPADNSLPNASDLYFWRITRNGLKVTVERSDDGTNFIVAATHNFSPRIADVIQYLTISYNTDASQDAYADYDYVRLTKGAN